MARAVATAERSQALQFVAEQPYVQSYFRYIDRARRGPSERVFL